MIIKKESKNILIKVKNYNRFDFIEEHIKCINKHGYTWIMKTGKNVNKEYLKTIIESNGGLIIKTPGRTNYSVYYCKLIDYNKNNIDNVYPNYYNELLLFEGIDIENAKKNLTWFKVEEIIKIPNELLEEFYSKSGNNIVRGATLGMTSTIFAYNKDEIKV